jgi:acyl-CoA synthetase (AMP-forming)/AMP-acid ligase II
MSGADIIRFLADIPRVQGTLRPDATAIVYEDRVVTYSALEAGSNRVARLLLDMGVVPGDRVAWLGRNCEAFFDVFFAAAKLRACLAPVNIRLAAPEIAFILGDTAPRVLFVTPDQREAAERAVAGLPQPPRIIVVDGAPAADQAEGPLDLPVPEITDDVLQLYTSGTTGHPKGVRLTNANYEFFLDIRNQIEGFDYGADETVLIVMPLFHVAGTNISFAGLASGSRVIVLSAFAPDAVLQLIEEARVAHVFLAPAMIQMLLQAPQIASTDLSSLKTIAYGASPISAAVLAEAQARFGCGFIQFYGMTETTGAGSFLSPAAHTPDRLRSCGQVWPGLEMRIQNAEGGEAPHGDIGEIAIRGPAVMAGYWNRSEATADAITADGWLLTGDAGFRDAHGYFFVHDRVKDMIVSGGENVYPAEVENAILGCPGVADAAVIGVPSDKWGEEVKAVVVALPGEAPTAQAVIEWARGRIAGFKAPKSVDFVAALPRNPSGKVLRRELRAPYWEGRDRKVG